MAESSEDSRFLSVPKKNALSREIDRNDQSLDHVRSVCAIVKDAVYRDIDSIQDFLQELLTPDTLFDNECQIKKRVFFIVRRILEDIGVAKEMDRSRERISIKVARALNINEMMTARKRKTVSENSWRRKKARTSRLAALSADAGRTNANTSRTPTNDNHSLSRDKAAVASAFKDEDKFTICFCKSPSTSRSKSVSRRSPRSGYSSLGGRFHTTLLSFWFGFGLTTSTYVKSFQVRRKPFLCLGSNSNLFSNRLATTASLTSQNFYLHPTESIKLPPNMDSA